MKIISGLLLFHPVIIFSKVPNHTFIGGYFMIVKNLLVVGVVAGFASAAAAQDSKGSWSVGGKVRVDAQQSTTETEFGGVKATSKSSMVGLNRAQFTLNGARDGHGLALTYHADSNELYTAVINHKFSDMITAHFGKMRVLSQSVENSYEEIDQYLWSWAKMHAPANSTGVRVDLAFAADHAVSIQAVEGVAKIGEGEDALEFERNGGLTTALQYRGNLSNGMVKPIVTYTQVRTSARKSGTVDYSNGYMNQLGLGAQISVANAAVDLEYDSGTMLKDKADKDAKDATMTSIVAQVKYPVGATTPFLKVTSDTMKMGADKGVGDQTGMNLALGVEHALDASCRLHAVYTSQAGTTEAGEGAKDTKMTTTGFNFGITASM
jgi:hypothetical protein